MRDSTMALVTNLTARPRLEEYHVACVFLFPSRRKVRPPTTDLLADWIDSWNRGLRGGRRRTSSTLAIPAGATLGFVQLFLHRMGGI